VTTVLVTGASGFVGRHLCASLAAQGVQIIALQHRTVAAATPGVRVVQTLDALPDDLQLDAIVNLAGAPILRTPWTASRRRLLLSSRLDTTASVVKLISRLQQRPQVLLSASAVGYYGVRGDEPLDESATGQAIFQSELCQRWEQAALPVGELGVRVVLLRFGVVLGTDGGALPPQVLPARLGVAAVLGSGRQGMPWIHIDDAVGIIELALRTPLLRGALNLVAPGHVTQRQFQRVLTQVLQRPLWLRVPAWPVRLLLGEMTQLLLDGQHVVPKKCLEQGYAFRHPQLRGALEDLLASPTPTKVPH
jgi:uncharacterized protein (TIGR01777 family)